MEVAFRQSVTEAKQRGQTVFLSSHILSEVEALCDRVGILRAGRLVDSGTLAQLRHLRAQVIDVTFAGSPPGLEPLDGVTVTPSGPSTLRFEVAANLDVLLGVLARNHPLTLQSREPSLEEIFLHHYDGSGAGDVGG
jgi:ABC-2 type transport system ATP-binding protein